MTTDAMSPHNQDGDAGGSKSGLSFDVARNVADVERAWELVYRSYLRAGLIRPNPQEIHTLPEATRASSAVMIGQINGLTVSTMSTYLDVEGRLPLDAGYPRELDGLRAQGRRLMEAGLFADRREHIARSMAALMELMRHTFFYAFHNDAQDIVIGVHPHHAGFYEKCFGFERFGDDSACPHTNGAPLVPLRLDIPTKYNQERLPRGLAFFKRDPLDKSAFDYRFRFSAERLAGSRIEAYLEERARQQTQAA